MSAPWRSSIVALLLVLASASLWGQEDPPSTPSLPESQAPAAKAGAAETLVGALDFERFKENIRVLAAFGSREWSAPGNAAALEWIEEQLRGYGYEVDRHEYDYAGQRRHNVYATKVGATQPEGMYIVSAHMDSFNVLAFFPDDPAPGADDDASGVSLVLEAARVFGAPEVVSKRSIRFVLWNNEETGLDGSKAYVRDRRLLQGEEQPEGSGRYPEPVWLGVIQHDMLLFDHGLPPARDQREGADIDVEYAQKAARAAASRTLGEALLASAAAHAAHPAELGSEMSHTDSVSFQEHCPAVSVRENQRLSEIGRDSNPHWHMDTDVPATYSEADYRLGFSAVQTTVGTLAELAGATIEP